MGFALGFICLNYYVTLGGKIYSNEFFTNDSRKQNKCYYAEPPAGIDQSSPQWIGAWWLGFPIVCAINFCIAIIFFFFPRRLPGSAALRHSVVPAKENRGESQSDDAQEQAPPAPQASHKGLRPILHAAWLVIADPILVGIAVGRTLDAIAIIGYFIFEPKYIELQFRVAPGIASIGISVLLLAWGTGIALGGLLIRWLKLRLAGIAMLITVATLIQVFGYSSMMLISCDPVDLRGLDGPTCAQSCECTLEQLAPVCDEAAQQSYVSACAAGCNTFDGNLTYTGEGL